VFHLMSLPGSHRLGIPVLNTVKSPDALKTKIVYKADPPAVVVKMATSYQLCFGYSHGLKV
jgi:hypothetical protein